MKSLLKESIYITWQEATKRMTDFLTDKDQIIREIPRFKNQLLGSGEMIWDPELKQYRYIHTPSVFRKTFFGK